MPNPYYSPNGDEHVIKYLFTTLDIMGTAVNNSPAVADLPCNAVTFSLTFNTSGPFSATINVESAAVRNTNWITATAPGKSFFWVEEDGVLIFGGRILNRAYSLSQQQVTITGSDFYSYWTQRLQYGDYGTYTGLTVGPGDSGDFYTWYKNPGVPAPYIAWQVLNDAAEAPGQLPNLLVTAAGKGGGDTDPTDPRMWDANYPVENQLTFSAPLSQMQTVDSIVQEVVGMGWLAGCDVCTEVSYETGGPFTGGYPQAQTYVYWPRKGTAYVEEPVFYPYYTNASDVQVLDLSDAIDVDWSEDATSQATGIVEQIGSNGAVQGAEKLNSNAMNNQNYPLVEQAISHVSTSPVKLSPSVINLLELDDAAQFTYPQVAPIVTMPISDYGTGFGLQALTTLLGSDVLVYNPVQRQTTTLDGYEDAGLPSIPFPPPGFQQIMRIVRVDVTINDSGVSTCALTLNWPPSLNPVPPNVYEPTGPGPEVTGVSS